MGNSSVGRLFSMGGLEFSFVRPLGAGGFADVFLVKNATANQKKSASPWLQQDYYALKRIQVHREDVEKVSVANWEIALNNALANRQHPNLVHCIAAEERKSISGVGGVDGGAVHSDQYLEYFLLLEYCPGGTLLDFLAQGKMKGKIGNSHIKDLLTPFLCLLNAISFLHCHEPAIFHRDIKMENLVLSGEKKKLWKLLDFGSSGTKIWKASNAGERVEIQAEIERNTTPSYRAPEMLDLYSGWEIGAPADCWALGVVLYQILFRENPFSDGSLAAISGRYRIPENHSYSQEILDLLAGLLTVDPNKRLTARAAQEKVAAMLKEKPLIAEPWASGVSTQQIRARLLQESGRKSISGPIARAPEEKSPQASDDSEWDRPVDRPRSKTFSVPASAQSEKSAKAKKLKAAEALDDGAEGDVAPKEKKKKSGLSGFFGKDKKVKEKKVKKSASDDEQGEARAPIASPSFKASPAPVDSPMRQGEVETKDNQYAPTVVEMPEERKHQGESAGVTGKFADFKQPDFSQETSGTVADMPETLNGGAREGNREEKQQEEKQRGESQEETTPAETSGGDGATIADLPEAKIPPPPAQIQPPPPPPPPPQPALPVQVAPQQEKSSSIIHSRAPSEPVAEQPKVQQAVPPPPPPAPQLPAHLVSPSPASLVPASISSLPSELDFHRSRVYSILEDFAVEPPRAVLEARLADLLITSNEEMASLFKKLLKKDASLFKLKYLRQFICSSWAMEKDFPGQAAAGVYAAAANGSDSDPALLYRGLPDFFPLLQQRPIHKNSVTAFKSLLLIHRLLFQGSPAILQQIFAHRMFFVEMDNTWSKSSLASIEDHDFPLSTAPILDLLSPYIKFLVRRVFFLYQYRQFEGNFSLSYYLSKLFHHPLYPQHWKFPCSLIKEQISGLFGLLLEGIQLAAFIMKRTRAAAAASSVASVNSTGSAGSSSDTSGSGDFDEEMIKLRYFLLIPLLDDVFALWLTGTFLLTQLALYMNCTAARIETGGNKEEATASPPSSQHTRTPSNSGKNAAAAASSSGSDGFSSSSAPSSGAAAPSGDFPGAPAVSVDYSVFSCLSSMISCQQDCTAQLQAFFNSALQIPLIQAFRRLPSIPRRINPFQPLQPLYFPPHSFIPALTLQTLRLALSWQVHIQSVGAARPLSRVPVDDLLAAHEENVRKQILARENAEKQAKIQEENKGAEHSQQEEEKHQATSAVEPPAADNNDDDDNSPFSPSPTDPFDDPPASGQANENEEIFHRKAAEDEEDEEEEKEAKEEPADPFTEVEEEKEEESKDPFDNEATPFEEEEKIVEAPSVAAAVVPLETPFDEATPFEQPEEDPVNPQQPLTPPFESDDEEPAKAVEAVSLEVPVASPFDLSDTESEDFEAETPTAASVAVPVFPSYSLSAADYTLGSKIVERFNACFFHGICRGSDVLIKRFAANSINRRLFESELTFLTRLRHPNLILLIGAVEHANEFDLVFESIPETLQSFLYQKQPSLSLSFADRLSLSLDVARGLSFLHQHSPPIVYRQLSSDSLNVERRGFRLKLAEFGRTKIFKDKNGAAQAPQTPRAGGKRNSLISSNGGHNAGMIYLAPELLECLNSPLLFPLHTPASDVFALGMVMWEIWTNEKPFAAWKGKDLRSEIIGGLTPDKCGEVSPAIAGNPAIAAILAGCWLPASQRLSALAVVEQLKIIQNQSK